MTRKNITGERIQFKRKQLRLTQEVFAQSVGVARQTISSWERGEFIPDSDNLKKIANVLRVSVAYLIGETDDPKGDTTAAEPDQPSIPEAAVEPPTESGIVFDYEDKDKKIHLTFAKDTPVEVMQTIIREAMQLPPGDAHKPTGTLPHAVGGDVVG